MPCDVVKTDGGTLFLCRRGRAGNPVCKWCASSATILCDQPKRKRTCSARCCEAHAWTPPGWVIEHLISAHARRKAPSLAIAAELNAADFQLCPDCKAALLADAPEPEPGRYRDRVSGVTGKLSVDRAFGIVTFQPDGTSAPAVIAPGWGSSRRNLTFADVASDYERAA